MRLLYPTVMREQRKIGCFLFRWDPKVPWVLKVQLVRWVLPERSALLAQPVRRV